MIFDIAGQGMSVGQSLRSHIEEHGNAVMKKLLPGAIDLRAVVSKHHFKFHVHLTINPGIKNFFIKSDADALDPYDAFDQALKKAEGKIRRYKEHQNHKHVSQKKIEVRDAMASNTVDVNSYIVHHDHESNMQLNVTNKKIKQLPVLPLSEAVMHMDFESKENYMFVNEENDKITVLHKQSDGSIVCVEV